jgi:hypothetical protein
MRSAEDKGGGGCSAVANIEPGKASAESFLLKNYMSRIWVATASHSTGDVRHSSSQH